MINRSNLAPLFHAVKAKDSPKLMGMDGRAGVLRRMAAVADMAIERYPC
jgi:hypothetical protein